MTPRILENGEFFTRARASKLVLGLLAVLTFLDSGLAPRSAYPGREISFFLGWGLVTRLWLVAPSRPLLGFCLVISVACISTNHGLLTTIGILHSFYFYFVSTLLIVLWERLKGFLGMIG